MIESVKLASVPAFEPAGATLGPLTTVNFVFGPNGAGKTSVSRAIELPAVFAGTELSLVGSTDLQVRVFNKDYAQRTFGNEAGLSGVFVLGRESKEAQEERAELDREAKDLRGRVSRCDRELGTEESRTGKNYAIAQLRERLGNTIWSERVGLPKELQPAFDGFHGSKSKLMIKVLEHGRGAKSVDIKDEDPLCERARTAFNSQATAIDAISVLSIAGIREVVLAEVWSQSIRGSSEVTVAELIENLRNSDWVREGVDFLNASDGRCPFCQQEVSSELAGHLENYFDEEYSIQIAALERDAESLGEYLRVLEAGVEERSEHVTAWIETSDYAAQAAALTTIVNEYRSIVEKKIASPSEIVNFPEITEAVGRLDKLIRKANSRIEDHNQLVHDRTAAVRELTNDVWNYFVWGRLDSALAVFLPEESILSQEIESLAAERAECLARIIEIDARLHVLAKSATSSQRAIGEINKMLVGAGFGNFKLTQAAALADGYQIVRDDGTTVDDTLSEGEQSFITFLYFLHELRGVDPQLGRVPDTVAVIDDPISSLDSSSLFFVSSQVRTLAQEALLENGTIKQLILLTHNVYFHKEVTYAYGRWKKASKARNRVSFHLIEKNVVGPNSIIGRTENPISTTYALLWEEICRAQDPPQMTVSIQNSMRRILETYFGFAGDIDLSKLPEMFDGTERMICRSLISWLHDGSHSTDLLDAIHYSQAGNSPEPWLRIFKEIFEKSGHIAHHDMMLDGA